MKKTKSINYDQIPSREDCLTAAKELKKCSIVLEAFGHDAKPNFSNDLKDLAFATAAMHFCNIARMMDGARGAASHVATCYDMAERLANLSNCPAPLELEPR